MKFFNLLEKLYPGDFTPLKEAGGIVLVRHMLRDYEGGFVSDIAKNTKTLEQWIRIQNTKGKWSSQLLRSKTVVSFCHPKFYDEKGGHARFVGIFRNHSGGKPKPLDIRKDLPGLPSALTKEYIGGERKNRYHFFDLRRVRGFEDLERRIVIDWRTPRHHSEWVQTFDAREHEEWNVREILPSMPEGYVHPFSGIEHFTLSFGELQSIVEYPDAHRDWHTALSSVAGIYAIRYNKELYVGMASGKDGIIGRWKDYAKDGHGGNQKLKALPQNAKHHFQFSVLQTLSLSLRKTEIAKWENRWKEKLGSRNWLNIR